mmetsp:Transcript_136588/g.424381  ORF Transcript_136588/g.424381 Transcript_136588/m.424381 type:complete len:427 (+) Transcript_136588:138-1418(+)
MGCKRDAGRRQGRKHLSGDGSHRALRRSLRRGLRGQRLNPAKHGVAQRHALGLLRDLEAKALGDTAHGAGVAAAGDERSRREELPLLTARRGAPAAPAGAVSASEHHRLVRVQARGLLGGHGVALAGIGGGGSRRLGLLRGLAARSGTLAAPAGAVGAGKHHGLVRVQARRLLGGRVPALAHVGRHREGLQLALRGGLVDQLHELLSADLLLVQELLREGVEEVPVGREELHAALVLLLDDALHLGVDLLPEALGDRGGAAAHEVPAHEGTSAAAAALLAEDALPHDVRHAELHHHGLRHLSTLLEVVRCSRGHVGLPVDNLLRKAAAKGHAHAVLQELLGVEPRVEALLRGHEDGDPARGPARHDADLGHHVKVVHQRAEYRMAGLMVGDELALLLRHHRVLLLQADGDALERAEDVVLVDLRLV